MSFKYRSFSMDITNFDVCQASMSANRTKFVPNFSSRGKIDAKNSQFMLFSVVNRASNPFSSEIAAKMFKVF